MRAAVVCLSECVTVAHARLASHLPRRRERRRRRRRVAAAPPLLARPGEDEGGGEGGRERERKGVALNETVSAAHRTMFQVPATHLLLRGRGTTGPAGAQGQAR